MSAQSHLWYIRGEDDQPAGPYTADQVIEALRAGRADPNTICWCEGMPNWHPLAHVEPFASGLRSAASALPRRRRTGVWIFVGVAATVILILGVVAAFLLIQGGMGAVGLVQGAAGLHLSDLERTKRWALMESLNLVVIRQKGNTIRLDDARKELERKLQGYVGKRVSWSIPVVRVDKEVVVLEDHWTRGDETSRKMFSMPMSESECYLRIACGQEPNGDSKPFGMLFGGTAPVALTIGRQIRRSDAAKLTRGDHCTLHAVIEKIAVSSDCILVRLGEAEAAASQSDGEGPSSKPHPTRMRGAGERKMKVAPTRAPGEEPPVEVPSRADQGKEPPNGTISDKALEALEKARAIPSESDRGF